MYQLNERFLKSVFKENKPSERLKNFNCLDVGAVSISKLTIEDQLLNCVSNVSALVKETTDSRKDTKWGALFLSFNILLDKLIIDDFLNFNLEKNIDDNTKIVSNLPYYLSTQILLKVLPFNDGIKEVMFTFQQEVADRIISQPNNKNYSRLSVIVQSVCDIKKRQNLPAKIF